MHFLYPHPLPHHRRQSSRKQLFELRVKSLRLEQYIMLLSQSYCVNTSQHKVCSCKGGIKISRDQNLSKPKSDSKLRLSPVICPLGCMLPFVFPYTTILEAILANSLKQTYALPSQFGSALSLVQLIHYEQPPYRTIEFSSHGPLSETSPIFTREQDFH